MMIPTPSVNAVTGQKVKPAIRGFGAVTFSRDGMMSRVADNSKSHLHPSFFREYMQHFVMDGLGQSDEGDIIPYDTAQEMLASGMSIPAGAIITDYSGAPIASGSSGGGTDWARVLASGITAGTKLALPLLVKPGTVVQSTPQGETIMRQTAGVPVQAPFTGSYYGANAGIGSSPGVSGGMLLGLAAGVGLLAMFMFSKR